MNVVSILRGALTCTVYSFLGLGTAYAGYIATPVLFTGGGTQIICVANNVSSRPITVTVTIIGVLGNNTDTCALPANSNDSCQAFRNNDAGCCKISVVNVEQAEVRDRVRGVLFNRKTVSPFTIETAVQAQ